jgi:hypothetical protein
MIDELRELVDRIRRRWFRAVALQIVSRAMFAVALIVLCGAVADRVLAPAEPFVLMLGAAVVLLSAGAVAAAIWPYRHRPGDARVARLIEERCPELEDAVASAVDVAGRPGDADPFRGYVVSAGVGRLRDIDPARVIAPAWIRRGIGQTAAAAVVLAAALAFAAPFVSRAAQIAVLRFLPGAVTIDVIPGNVRVPAGTPLRIVARIGSRTGGFARVPPELTLEARGQARTVPMILTPDGFEVRINAVDRSFAYRVRAGGAASPEYSVTALFPPHVRRIDLRYEYPSFTGLEPRDERDGGDIYGPAGTRVRLRVETDKPVTSAALALSDAAPPIALAPAGDRVLESTLTLERDASYRVALEDADGLSSKGLEYFIRVMDDRPPEVHLLRPVGDQQITPLEEVTIEARADDDYGVASLELVYSVSGGPEKIVPFGRMSGTETARLGSSLVAAEDLGVKPGDVISYYARARDVSRGKASSLARSEMLFLEVKPFNEEYVAAQSQAMAAQTDTELESLVAAQKEVISATWNIERRTAAGRSAADIKAVADAQAEVKRRAEQTAGALTPRRRRLGGGLPQQTLPSPSDATDPVAAAADAMGRALQQLQGQRTTAAIPHEMAALNALLRAQADVRRRQVTQSNNASANRGSGRQGQDLSSLFDRELKRQQKNNYETKAEIEERPDQQKTDDLDRIRELAKRQEALAREQRELARAEPSEEELKRELEKLTREQTELQREIETVQPRATGAATAAGAKGAARAGAAGASSPELKDAAEQMRGATADLRRQGVGSAAARGERAAEQLRKLERDLQTATPDARKRAIGELQLEAQQLAEAQRRVAGEAQRLDAEGGGTVDARRRLAAGKESLADRVDRLRDAARRLSGDPRAGTAADRTAIGEAARDLDRQQLGARMRAGATDMRNGRGTGAQPGTSQTPLAPAERDLAEAMERVAGRMNGADAGGAKGQTQRLADALDEAREARDRLARLEQKIRDARRQASPEGQPPGQAGARGAEGSRGQRGSSGGGAGSADLARLQDEYARELQRTRELLGRVDRAAPQSGRGQSTPEEHEWSRSAPGTESWKNDYGAWEGLHQDVTRALERYEASVADRLSRALTADRLRAGGSDRVPDAYRQRIARYFESLAQKK